MSLIFKSNRIMKWSSKKSSELYGVDQWGRGYFQVSKSGDLEVLLKDGRKKVAVSLPEIINGLRERGTQFPLLLRFGDLLQDRISHLNDSFAKAIKLANYQGLYRGVYPIKVNQQQEVIEEVTRVGRKYHYGLEAGSKPELLAALAYMQDPEALIICNGYKDEEFINLALYGLKMGLQVIMVIEMPGEIDLILERSKAMGVTPMLGIRARLSAKSSGHWSESGGDRSVFGLGIGQIMDIVNRLKAMDLLKALRMLHYHQGSQIPNIIMMRQAANEAARIYVELIKEGAPMGYFDMGGGLAVNYEGNKTGNSGGTNYDIMEYCSDMVEVVKTVADNAGVPHPNLVSESGRAVVAYYSVLIFNILDVNEFSSSEEAKPPEDGSHEVLESLFQVWKDLKPEKVQECLNDAIFYRDEIRSLFVRETISLRERGYSEKLYWCILSKIWEMSEDQDYLSDQIQELETLLTDYYYGNFSVFQSVPDSWAIGQLFPVMPIHRLEEEPTRKAVIADITCDCDGKIDHFIDPQGTRKKWLPVHKIGEREEDYLLGVFMVGAYQETLGDLHNLLGDTNVVSVKVEKGRVRYQRELEGDRVKDVLSYVEYDPKALVKKFRELAERSVEQGKITARERKSIMNDYDAGIRGYTYFES